MCLTHLMHFALLLIWMAIAAFLRFTHIADKPLWADEFSTLVFSLGNSFLSVPLDQGLTLNELLQPLQPNSQATPVSVVHHLLSESNHPPLYFVLSHLWLRLFSPIDGFVSVWAARALSAVCGVLAVPASFGLSWLAWRSRLAAHLAAALMTVSPFGVYLAQEARHYTLAILWILASLSCLVAVAQLIQTNRRIPLWLCCLWISVNGLGIATHYFVLLTLFAAAIALLLWLFLFSSPISLTSPLSLTSLTSALPRLLFVALGTLASALVWFPVLLSIRGTELTRWIQTGEFDKSTWIDQLLRFVAGLITMLYLLPVQEVPLPVIITSAVVLVLLLAWTVPLLVRGWRNQTQQPETRSMLLLLGGFVITAIALSLLLTFGLGVNFASVFRYQFFYFPAVVLVVGGALAQGGRQKVEGRGVREAFGETPGQEAEVRSQKPGELGLAWVYGRWAIAGVLLFSLLGGITVANDLGYQRTHRPEKVAAAIHANFQHPALVAIPHKTHGHTGRLMGIAWELHRLNPAAANQTTFLLAHIPGQDPQPAIATLQRTVQSLPRPLDIWRVNFRSEANPLSQAVLSQAGCVPVTKLLSVDGYRYQKYTCG
ncbi:MAG: glycosyltransferase [Oscillatoriales cyanobacterium C42_A2020_001]|nr:glycosyltransferase [Leptolyngbyaceae cyanobacterium C42_A2020_001]